MERHTSKAAWPATSFAKGRHWLSWLNLETWSPQVWMSKGMCSSCSWSRVWMVSSQSRTCCFSSVSWMSSCFQVVTKSSTFFWTSSSQRRDTGVAAASLSAFSPGALPPWALCTPRALGSHLLLPGLPGSPTGSLPPQTTAPPQPLEVALLSHLPPPQLLECLQLLPHMLPVQNLHGCEGRALSPGPPAAGVGPSTTSGSPAA